MRQHKAHTQPINSHPVDPEKINLLDSFYQPEIMLYIVVWFILHQITYKFAKEPTEHLEKTKDKDEREVKRHVFYCNYLSMINSLNILVCCKLLRQNF